MIHLNLQPEIEAQLAAQAEAHGFAIDRHIESLVVARAIDPESEPALDEALLRRDLQQGLREVAEGKTRPPRQVFDEMREKFGIPR
jgi:hypothetical protein